MRAFAYALGLALVVPLTVAALPTTASADDFGARGHLDLVVDNLAGFFHDGIKLQSQGEGGYYSLGGSPQYVASIFGAPITRFGVHYFVADGISVGGGLIWSDTSVLGSSITILGLAPRVGYGMKIDDDSGVWFRGGVSYLHYDAGQGSTAHSFALAAEIQYVRFLAPHLALTVGPMIEWGVSGSRSQTDTVTNTTQSIGEQVHLWGLSLGFLFDL